jgi:hypothetical protein
MLSRAEWGVYELHDFTYSLLELVTADDTLGKLLAADWHSEGSVCSNQFQ